jgi:hypothetical protein
MNVGQFRQFSELYGQRLYIEEAYLNKCMYFVRYREYVFLKHITVSIGFHRTSNETFANSSITEMINLPGCHKCLLSLEVENKILTPFKG